MIYKSLRQCVDDLEQNGHLIKIKEELDPNLEMAEIQRRVYQNKGPALLFENVKDCAFPAVSNLFGTIERSKFIFRSNLKNVKKLINAKADPSGILKSPFKYLSLPGTAFNALPKRLISGPVLKNSTTIDKLPQIKSWPDDGGAFILLPQVFSENPLNPGIMKSNLGMYRIQLGGNNYKQNQEIGLHYQIRRDIGIHHSNAIKKGEPLKVCVFVGGPPSHTFSAVMPLPEGLPEVAFAGALGGRGFRYTRRKGFVISTDADFCITGTIIPNETRPEGPFGDHLGYYSLKHEFPVLKIEKVYHRDDAIWPFTTVGRPPQEDTSFGKLIHEITGPMVEVSIPGVTGLHAVDAAGVHPLLLATGKERYIPYKKSEPMEILTHANAILGFGHCALAKFLIIAAEEDNTPDLNDIQSFFIHVLERVDFRRDLHFQTRTTIDTLDYSGSGLNQGSKVVIAAAGDKIRNLSTSVPADLSLPEGFKNPVIVMPGIIAIEAPAFKDEAASYNTIQKLEQQLETNKSLSEIPMIILTEDSNFAAKNLNNFLWVSFTRANPSHDIHGVKNFIKHKHWGCMGSLIIDARLKPHHAPPLIEDPFVTKKIDELGKKGGCLHGII